METKAQGQIGAFFDVDYTLLANNSASLFVKFMRREGKVGVGAMLTTVYYLVQYKLNILHFERLVEREVVKYKGMPEAEMYALCERWFNEMVAHYFYEEAKELIENHKRAGDIVVLLSATSIYALRPMARYLGVEHYLGNSLSVDENGNFTGLINRPICYGPGKIIVAEQFAAKMGIDLDRSFHYSDSITDLSALERFGRPTAVNPDPLLRKEAKRRGWPILKFTKVAGAKG